MHRGSRSPAVAVGRDGRRRPQPRRRSTPPGRPLRWRRGTPCPGDSPRSARRGELSVYEGGCASARARAPVARADGGLGVPARLAVPSRPTGASSRAAAVSVTEVFDVPDGDARCARRARLHARVAARRHAHGRPGSGRRPASASCSGGRPCPETLIEQDELAQDGRPSPDACLERPGASARSRRRDRLGLAAPRGRAALDPNGRAARRRRRAERDRLLRGRPARAGSTDVHAHDRRPAGCEPARPLRDADARRDSPLGREPGEPARASA